MSARLVPLLYCCPMCILSVVEGPFVRLSIALAVLLLPVGLFALDPSLSLSQYSKRHWQVEQGLPQNYVTSLAQEPGGLLVVGTSGGVARFDGISFYPVVLDEATGISREWINALAVLPAGQLWISSRDADVYLQEHGSVRAVGRLAGHPSSATVRRDGSLVSAGYGTWQFIDGELRQLATIGGGDLSWQGVMELDDDRLLICDYQGLFVLEGSSPRLLLPAGNALGRPLSLARGRQGRSYLGTTTGLFRLTVSTNPEVVPVPGVEGPVVSIVEDRDGIVWAATWGRGLFRIHGATALRWTQNDGLPDDFVHTLFEDEEGSLWIGSRSGLSRWRSGPIVPYGPGEGLHAQFLSSIVGDADGGIWVGTWRRGLHRYRQGAFKTMPTGFPEDTSLIRAMAFADDGSYWISDWYNLHHVGSRGWIRYTSEDLGFSAAIQAILLDRRGGLWLGGNHGLALYPGGVPTANPVSHLPGVRVRQLMQDSRGVVWAATDEGLYRFDGTGFHAVAGLPHPTVNALLEDSRGRVWAATRASGVVRIQDAQAIVFHPAQGLPEVPVFGLLEDDFGRLWMSSPGGLFAVPVAELDAVADGRQATLDPIAFRDTDGLRTIEFQNVGSPPAWRDRQGHLWFPSVRGLVEVRPEVWQPPQPPQVLLLGLHSSGRSHELRFTANRFQGAEQTQFRYRLRSWKTEWIPLRTERYLRLDSLSPGEHIVEIAARLPGSTWGAPYAVQILQSPRWFETYTFYAICLALSLVLLWAAYQWRLRQVRARFALIAAERNRIGREWHDTLLAGFSAIFWQLEAAMGTLRNNPDAAANAIALAGKMVNHYRTEARRVIWDLRHVGPEHEALPEALTRTLREIVRGADVERHIDVDGDASLLPPEMAQGILRICQEAALNASRHANPHKIEVWIRITEGKVQVRVCDDGQGFDPGRIEDGHFGVAIMKERAERFGGSLRVESAPGAGSTVLAEFPLHASTPSRKGVTA